METMAISPEREERRRRQKELADRLKASGAMDDIFAKIDAGEPLWSVPVFVVGCLGCQFVDVSVS